MASVNGNAVHRVPLVSSHRKHRLLSVAPLRAISRATALLSLAVCVGPVAARAQVTSSSSPSAAPAPAAADEQLGRTDVAVSGFARINRNVNANFILLESNTTGGGLLSLRQSLKPWLGYEVNYGYSRFSDYYRHDQVTDRVSHGMSELSFAYLLQGPMYKRIRPFLTVGGGAVIQTPVTTPLLTGEQPGTETSPAFVFGFGANVPNFYHHIGMRIQYRGLEYKAPDFGVLSLNTHHSRTTQEPTLGFYYRF